jgi:hypothetical protein
MGTGRGTSIPISCAVAVSCVCQRARRAALSASNWLTAILKHKGPCSIWRYTSCSIPVLGSARKVAL